MASPRFIYVTCRWSYNFLRRDRISMPCVALFYFSYIPAGPSYPILLLKSFISSSVAILWRQLCRCKLATRSMSLDTLWEGVTPPFMASSSKGELARCVAMCDCHRMCGVMEGLSVSGRGCGLGLCLECTFRVWVQTSWVFTDLIKKVSFC